MTASGLQLLVRPTSAREELAFLSNALGAAAIAFGDVMEREIGQRLSFTVESCAVETVGDALAPSPAAGVAATVKYADWEGAICVALPRDLIFDMTEAALGGDGGEPPLRAKRDFSETERRVARFLIEQLLACFAGAGKSMQPRDLRIERFEQRMEALGLPGADRAIVLNLVLAPLGRPGVVKLLLPEAARSKLPGAFGHRSRAHAAPNDAAWTKQVSAQVQLAEIGMRAVIRERMTLA